MIDRQGESAMGGKSNPDDPLSQNRAGPGSTDSGLLQGIRLRDEASWTQFVNEYSHLVYVWCRNCDLQPVDALDVSQQVFHAVSRSISGFTRQRGSFRGWLFVITKNLIRNFLSRSLRGPQAIGGTSVQLRLMEQPETIQEDLLSGSESSPCNSSLQNLLDSVRKRFDDQTWKCFWRVAIEEKSAVDVAKELGMKPAAVRQAKYRVTQRLRAELKDFC